MADMIRAWRCAHSLWKEVMAERNDGEDGGQWLGCSASSSRPISMLSFRSHACARSSATSLAVRACEVFSRPSRT